MDNSAIQLATLPPELLHCIFRHLDPVALIATSQTCTHFRSIIQPAKKHFAERLLALEIEPEHGGPGLTYFARENILKPDWNDEAWDRMRWACTHCLRLLSHAAFDNHSLLRLRNRKPTPGSTAAMRFSNVTSWEPVDGRALSAKAERKNRIFVAEEKAIQKLLKKQYHLATTKTLNDTQSTYDRQTRTFFLKTAALPEALELSDSQLDAFTEEQEHALLDRVALRIERQRAGSHRHLRKCNECRFKLGQFKQSPFIKDRDQQPGPGGSLTWGFNNNKGTPGVPIVRSRRLKFATPFDRYFPGIKPYMYADRPDFILPLWRIYREDTSYTANTMYMARCPSCTTWQELRAFRWPPRGWGYGEFIGIGCYMTERAVAAHSAEVEAMQCNKCVYEKLGHTVLGQRLSNFMKDLLARECCSALNVLAREWRVLNYGPTKPTHANASRIKHLLESLEAVEKKFAKIVHNEYRSDIDVHAADLEDNLALINRRRLEWLHISNEETELANASVQQSQSFAVWQNEWDEAMSYWRWAMAWMKEVENEPERVVKWALERRATKLN